MHSNYYNKQAIETAVEEGKHRAVIGGLWDELGSHQLNYLKSAGLQPDHTLLDIGCGSLRLGVQAVRYLNSDHYWGTDINASLLDAGYKREIVPAGLDAKLPRTNLTVDGEFTFQGVPQRIDFAIAQSVFTHLPLNHMRLCLANLANHLTGPCTFFFTVFTPPENAPVTQSYEQFPGIISHSHRDPYHYMIADVKHAAAGLPWRINFIGDWGHPRNQKIVRAQLDKSNGRRFRLFKM